MIEASVYGRLGADPIERSTNTGNLMATVSVAVDATRTADGAPPVWVSLAAFGSTAAALLRHRKGDLIAAMGPLHLRRYQDRQGRDRERWALTANAIVSARTVRPRGRPRAREPEQAA